MRVLKDSHADSNRQYKYYEYKKHLEPRRWFEYLPTRHKVEMAGFIDG